MTRPASARPHKPAPTTSSASSPDMPSPLLRLPDELLHTILDDLSLKDVKMCLDACRRLRAVAARRVFTSIRITEEADLLALATSFRHGYYVQSLTIDLETPFAPPDRDFGRPAYLYEDSDPDRWSPSPSDSGNIADDSRADNNDHKSNEELEPIETELIDLGGFTWTEPIFAVDQDSASSESDSDDEPVTFAATVQQILRSMPSLAHLSLCNLDWSEYADFLSDQAMPYLKNLVSIELEPPEWYRSALIAPESAQWWPLIAGLPNLKKLAFDDCFEICRARDSEEQITVLPSVEEVDILFNSRALLEINREAPTLRFPKVQKLTLRDSAEATVGWHRTILHTMPTSLQSLELHSLDEVEPAAADKVDWMRLHSLSHLTLTGPAFRPQALRQQISQLKGLTSITFGVGAPIEDGLLVTLLRNARFVLPRLELVQLDHVWCVRGPLEDSEISDDNNDDEWDDDAETPVLPGWAVPEWPEGCTEEGIVSAISLAEQAGIKLIGTALDTLGFDAEYNNEAYNRIWERAMRTRDARPAIKEYGFEAVLKYLKNRDWSWYERIFDAINPGVEAYRSESPADDYSDGWCG